VRLRRASGGCPTARAEVCDLVHFAGETLAVAEALMARRFNPERVNASRRQAYFIALAALMMSALPCRFA
jgi:hypothetical protein